MERIWIHTTLNTDDWVAYCAHAGGRASALNPSPLARVMRYLPALLPILLMIILALSSGPLGLPRFAALSALFAVCLYAWCFAVLTRVQSAPSKDGIFLGPAQIGISPEGMRMRRERYESFAAWSPAMEVTATPSHLFVWLDRMTAQVLPIRDLGTLDVSTVSATIGGYIARAAVTPSAPVPTDGPVDGPATEAAPTTGNSSAPAEHGAAVIPAIPAPAVRTAAELPSVAQECQQLLRIALMGAADRASSTAAT